MKFGIELKIDVTKIDKSKIFEGSIGKYLIMTSFVDTENQGQYGDNGMITHKKEKGEPNGAILGNATVFWKDESQQQQTPNQPASNQGFDDNDDDMPF